MSNRTSGPTGLAFLLAVLSTSASALASHELPVLRYSIGSVARGAGDAESLRIAGVAPASDPSLKLFQGYVLDDPEQGRWFHGRLEQVVICDSCTFAQAFRLFDRESGTLVLPKLKAGEEGSVIRSLSIRFKTAEEFEPPVRSDARLLPVAPPAKSDARLIPVDPPSPSVPTPARVRPEEGGVEIAL